MREGRDVTAGRPWLRAWLVAGVAAWAALGVLLVTRANNLGLVDDISISPYHLVGYAALLTVAAYVAWAFFRALRRGDWRRAFPPLYGGLALGFVLLLAWVILDPIWRDTLGISPGIENGLAPTRLLIPIALVLLASGPLREAIALRAERGLRPGERRTRWAGVVAAGLVGAALTMVAFNPIQTPAQDYAFLPAQDNTEIWIMTADGSAQTRLLAARGDGVDFSLPAWSPEGSRIAFTRWSNEGGAPQNLRNEDQAATIWTMAADGSDARPLVDPGAEAQAWIPAWSPDGRWLTYTLSPVGAPAAPDRAIENVAPGQAGPPAAGRGSAIWIVAADGSGARRLSAEGVDAVGATWAAEGDLIAYIASAGGGQSDIHVATVTESGLANDAVLAADPANDWGPAWSPDGDRIAFTSNRSGNEEIWSVPSGGGEPIQLTDDGAGDWVPAFTPDGSRIAFVSDRTGEPEVWSMAADGSDPRNLTNHPQHFDGMWSLSWAPDGSRMAYASAAFQEGANSGWVREDFAAAMALLFGLSLAVVALLVLALGAPAGSFALTMAIVVLAAAIAVDGWRFLPGAIIAGALVDVLVRSVPARLRARVASAALAALGNLAIGLSIGAGGTLAWSITLLLGVALASAAIGWGLAEAVERLWPQHARPDVVPDAETPPA